MSFSEDIKILRKRYSGAVKKYYNDDRILLKMLFLRRKYDDLYEADLAFRTCLISEFSDKNINRLFDADAPSAVEKLRARARGCAYTASTMCGLLENQISLNQQPSCDEIRLIRKELLNMANRDVELSDKLAKDINAAEFDKSEFEDAYKEPCSRYLDKDWFCK